MACMVDRFKCALLVALASCAPTLALTEYRPVTVEAYAADVVGFSAGMIVCVNELNKPEAQRDAALMYTAFAVALAFWLPHWFVSTE